MKRFMKKYFFNKKGLTVIEVAIFALIFIIILSFFVDLTIITWKFNAISRATTFVARIVSKQSGIKPYAPSGYPGGNSNYINTYSLYEQVTDELKHAGFKDSEWELTINNYKLNPYSNLEFRNPEQPIVIRLKANYSWSLISNFIPGNITKQVTSTRIVYPAFRYRDGNIHFIK